MILFLLCFFISKISKTDSRQNFFKIKKKFKELKSINTSWNFINKNKKEKELENNLENDIQEFLKQSYNSNEIAEILLLIEEYEIDLDINVDSKIINHLKKIKEKLNEKKINKIEYDNSNAYMSELNNKIIDFENNFNNQNTDLRKEIKNTQEEILHLKHTQEEILHLKQEILILKQEIESKVKNNNIDNNQVDYSEDIKNLEEKITNLQKESKLHLVNNSNNSSKVDNNYLYNLMFNYNFEQYEDYCKKYYLLVEDKILFLILSISDNEFLYLKNDLEQFINYIKKNEIEKAFLKMKYILFILEKEIFLEKDSKLKEKYKYYFNYLLNIKNNLFIKLEKNKDLKEKDNNKLNENNKSVVLENKNNLNLQQNNVKDVEENQNKQDSNNQKKDLVVKENNVKEVQENQNKQDNSNQNNKDKEIKKDSVVKENINKKSDKKNDDNDDEDLNDDDESEEEESDENNSDDDEDDDSKEEDDNDESEEKDD